MSNKPVELEICEKCGQRCGATLPYGTDCKKELHPAARHENAVYEKLRGTEIPEGFERLFRHLEADIDSYTESQKAEWALEVKLKTLKQLESLADSEGRVWRETINYMINDLYNDKLEQSIEAELSKEESK